MTPETPEEKSIGQAPDLTPAPVDVPVEGELLPPQQREAVLRQVRMQMEAYSGPLPHPSILKRYAELDSTAVDRIITMAEKQQNHEHARENKEDGRASMGIYAAVTVSAFAFGTSCVALLNGSPWAAGVIGTGSIAALVYTFVFGTNSNKEVQIEAVKKMPQINSPQGKQTEEEEQGDSD